MDFNKFKYYKWSFGDRYDGLRVKKIDTVFRVIPYFLRTRMDAQNFFEEKLVINDLEEFIKKHKDQPFFINIWLHEAHLANGSGCCGIGPRNNRRTCRNSGRARAAQL